MRIIGTTTDRPAGTQLRAIQFGYLGLVPFALAALVVWLTPALFTPAFMFSFVGWVLLYAAIILSFMGGARWGAAIRDWRPDKLLLTTLPALVAWLAVIPNGMAPGLFMDQPTRFAVLMVAFVALMFSELQAKGEWAPWYRTLRLRLSLATTAFLLLTVLGLMR